MIRDVGFRIALRYLFSKKTHNAVNYIAWIAVATTAAATMAIVIVLSVFNGFTELVLGKLSRFDAPYELVAAGDTRLCGTDSLLSVSGLSALGTVVPVVETKGYVSGGSGQATINLTGIDDRFLRQADIEGSVIAGVDYVGDTLGVKWGMAGIGLANRLGAWPGSDEPLMVMTPRRQGRINPGSLLSAFRTDTIYIAGIFRIEDASIDDNTLLVPMDVARRLGGYESDEATSIRFYPHESVSDAEIKSAAALVGLRALDVKAQNVEAFRMINIEKWISFALLLFILIIASFNIVSTLSMLIIEKRGNMSVLRAMGLDEKGIKRVFIWEGILLSVFGAVAGAVIGCLLVVCQKLFGFVKLSGGIDSSMLSISYYPVALNAEDFLVVGALVVVLSLIVGLVAVTVVPTRNEKIA